MKKTLSIILALLMCFSSIFGSIGTVAAADSNAQTAYTFGKVNAKAGETVDIPVTFTSASAVNLTALSRITFSTADVEIIGFTYSDVANALINKSLSNYDKNTNSIVTLFNEAQAFPGGITLGTLQIKLADNTPDGEISISAQAAAKDEFGAGDIPVDAVEETIKVGEIIPVVSEAVFTIGNVDAVVGDTITVDVWYKSESAANISAIASFTLSNAAAEIVGFEFSDGAKAVINENLSNYDPSTKSVVALFKEAMAFDGLLGTLQIKIADDTEEKAVEISAYSRVKNENDDTIIPSKVVGGEISISKVVIPPKAPSFVFGEAQAVQGDIASVDVSFSTEVEVNLVAVSSINVGSDAQIIGFEFSEAAKAVINTSLSNYDDNTKSVIVLFNGAQAFDGVLGTFKIKVADDASAGEIVITASSRAKNESVEEPIESTVEAGKIIVEAKPVPKYTVTYKVDGAIVKEYTDVEEGSVVPAYVYEVAEGYTFSGWDYIPDTVTENIVISGTTTINTYTVTYKVNGEVVKTENVVYGAAIPAYEYEVAEGYTFSGWDAEVPATMPAKNLEFNGTTTANSYTVTYKVNGNVVKTVEVAFGAAISAYEYEAAEGYTFSGWDAEVPATMPAKNLEFNGTTTANTYTVTYKVNGNVVNTVEVVFGAAIPAYEYEALEGYSFSGWDAEVPATMPAKNLEFNGTTTAKTYTVTYKVNGEVVSTAEVVFGAEIPAYNYEVAEGYTFSGWDAEVPATMPAKDLEFNGTTTIKTFTVTYKVNGEVVKTFENVEYGAEVPAYDYEVAEGYTFSGWSEAPATVTEDVEITGTTAIKTFTVTYKVNGEVVKTFENVEYGAEVPAYDYEVAEGYTFSGWSEAPATVTEDVEITGTTAIKTFTVTYKVNGEVVKTFENVEYGAEVPAYDYEVAEGYTFSGWSEAPATVTEDVEITGTTAIKTFTVTYKVNGEVVKTFENVEYGAEVPAYDYEVAEGYTFSGWSEAPATVTEDVEITGTTAIKTFTVTYKVNGEVVKTFENVEYGAEVPAYDYEVAEGYTFSGWSEAPATVTEDVEITGTTAIKTFTVTYKVNGEVVKTFENVEYGAEVPAYDYEVAEGYTFSGWSEAPATVTEDVEITGTTAIKTFTVTYKVNGEVVKTFENVAYGSEVPEYDYEAPEGFSFKGWSEIPDEVTEDLIIEGNIIENRYTITYVVNGEVVKEDIYDFGAVIEVYDYEAPEGYTFSGWDVELPKTMPATNITVTGTTEAIPATVYTVTFKAEGAEDVVVSVEDGAAIGDKLPADASKEGYTFVGWYVDETKVDADFVVTGNVTAEAVFTVNQYTITYVVDGEIVHEATYDFGATIEAYEYEVADGYTFSGWDVELPETMPATNITVTGTTEEISGETYTVTFKVEGEEDIVINVAAGQAIGDALVEVSKEGFEFVGWFTEDGEEITAETVVEADIVAIAKFAIKKGDINGDGRVTSDDAILLLNHIVLPQYFSIDAYLEYYGDIDFNGDGKTTSKDAVYLLNSIVLPGIYSLR